MKEITPQEVANVLEATKSARFVAIRATTPARLNKTNGKRKKEEKVERPWDPVVKVATYRGAINRDWELAVMNARMDEGLDPEGWQISERRNGLVHKEDRPASTLVVHPDDKGGLGYVRLVHRISPLGFGIEIGTSRYYWGEGGPELSKAQLRPFFPNRKESEVEGESRRQGDPDRRLQCPVLYRDITLARIREIRAHGNIWVVRQPIIEFPPPIQAVQAVEGAVGGAGVETDTDVQVKV